MGGLLNISRYLELKNPFPSEPYGYNIDNIKTLSLYRLSSSATGGPFGLELNGSVLICIPWDLGSFHQLLFNFDSAVLYYRVSKVNVFTNWTKISSTLV